MTFNSQTDLFIFVFILRFAMTWIPCTPIHSFFPSHEALHPIASFFTPLKHCFEEPRRGKREKYTKRCQNTRILRIRSDSFVYVIFYWHNLFSPLFLALFMKFMIGFHRRFCSRSVWSLSWRFVEDSFTLMLRQLEGISRSGIRREIGLRFH